MYACLAVTCHLHFWQNDRDFLRATVVTRGWNGYRNKSQHRKSTLENKIIPPFQQGFEPATFQSRVRRSNHWAIPAPNTDLVCNNLALGSIAYSYVSPTYSCSNTPSSAFRHLLPGPALGVCCWNSRNFTHWHHSPSAAKLQAMDLYLPISQAMDLYLPISKPWTYIYPISKPWTYIYPYPSHGYMVIVQELCESRGSRPGLSVLTSLLFSVDVKNYWTVLQALVTTCP